MDNRIWKQYRCLWFGRDHTAQGKIQGGDGSYFYIGSYEESNVSGANIFRAKINVKPFLPRAKSFFNTFDQELILNLEGTLKDENNAVAVGRSEEIPGVDLGVRLTRRPEAA